MNRLVITILVLAALLFPLTAAAFLGLGSGNVPNAADEIADQLDDQLMMRYAGDDPGMSAKNRKKLARAHIMIMGTTPVNINDLEQVCPLARQMMEEISTALMDKGYRFQELRKGRDIRFDKKRGEFLLTRDVRKLLTTSASSQAIMAGTYVITPKQVRFSIRLLHTPGNEVLAMGSGTVPITEDLRPLLRERPIGSAAGSYSGDGIVPPVTTRLQ
ncbi:MAG: hypothetical protein J5861_07540 [Desulfovibrio sp.]|nr:hypothetical protein [Desulfovibrio sp.]